MRLAGADWQPCSPIACKQAIGRVRARAASGVIRKAVVSNVCPLIQDALPRAPCRLDCIGAREQGGIANQAVVDECLLGYGRKRGVIIAVGYVHLRAADFDWSAGTLGAEARREP